MRSTAAATAWSCGRRLGHVSDAARRRTPARVRVDRGRGRGGKRAHLGDELLVEQDVARVEVDAVERPRPAAVLPCAPAARHALDVRLRRARTRAREVRLDERVVPQGVEPPGLDADVARDEDGAVRAGDGALDEEPARTVRRRSELVGAREGGREGEGGRDAHARAGAMVGVERRDGDGDAVWTLDLEARIERDLLLRAG